MTSSRDTARVETITRSLSSAIGDAMSGVPVESQIPCKGLVSVGSPGFGLVFASVPSVSS